MAASTEKPPTGHLWTLAGPCVLALAALAAYHNCFSVPFVYDDTMAIADNPTIRRVWGSFTWPAGDTTVGGRPLANVSLALNYALSGTGVWSYHAANLLVHVLAAWVLFGVIRRTLLRPVLAARFGGDSGAIAFTAALLWVVHPIQTEAVTYVIQRVESLMALFFLLTLYCVIRSAESARPFAWQAGAVAACLLGMATKEVMAAAPLVVLLYDRTFVSGSFRRAWLARRGLYLGLAATWVPLFLLAGANGWNRRGSAGFGAGVPAPEYWIIQLEAIARYLQLSAWPRPLVFEYGPFRRQDVAGALPFALVTLPVAAATAWALWRKPALGFPGAFLFLILAPSSLVPVATQTIAEHRMYLPLAAVAAGAAAGAYIMLRVRGLAILGVLAVGLGMATSQRNEDYRSELSLWQDTVVKRPQNADARSNLGLALFRAGRVDEAIGQYEAALEIEPDYPGVHNNLGNALDSSGRTAEAVDQYRAAIRAEPAYAAAHFNLGRSLAKLGRLPEAIAELGVAAELAPDRAAVRYELGNALAQAGRFPEAIGAYEAALRIQPDLPEASNNLGMVLCRSGRMQEGVERIRAAIRMRPDFAQAHFALGTALLQGGLRDEATAEYERVLELRPGDPGATRMLDLIRSSR